MKETKAGSSGPKVRSDIEISLTDKTSGPTEIHLTSSVESMYGEAIRRQIAGILDSASAPPLTVHAIDSGALPFVIEARMEAALAEHLQRPLSGMHAIEASTNTAARIRRSRLYVPGSTPKLMPSIGLFGADSVILDLEDSVAPSEKPAALALVRRALTALDFGRSEKLVRVNSGPAGLHEMHTLIPAGPDGFVLPKVESPEQVLAAARVLEESGSHAVLLPIIESALGLQMAYAIASCHHKVAAVALGVEDYLADLGAERSLEGGSLDWALITLVNACRAAKVSPLGPIYGQVDDEEGMKLFASRMAAIGCDGVGCLHPRQIAPAHEGLRPSPEKLEQARKIVAAFDEAQSRGEGVISLDGRMVDPPVAAQARRLLARAGESS